MPKAPRASRFDQEAMEAIVSAIRAKGSIELEFDTPAAATYNRHQFYAWRKQRRELTDDFSLEDIVIQRAATRLVFREGFGSGPLRKALQSAGVLPDGE